MKLCSTGRSQWHQKTTRQVHVCYFSEVAAQSQSLAPGDVVARLCRCKARCKKVVVKLKCKVCADFADRIRGQKNFSNKWIVEADSVSIGNVCDHARNDQHAHAITSEAIVFLACRLRSLVLCSYCSGFQQAVRWRERQATSEVWHSILIRNQESPINKVPQALWARNSPWSSCRYDAC